VLRNKFRVKKRIVVGELKGEFLGDLRPLLNAFLPVTKVIEIYLGLTPSEPRVSAALRSRDVASLQGETTRESGDDVENI